MRVRVLADLQARIDALRDRVMQRFRLGARVSSRHLRRVRSSVDGLDRCAYLVRDLAATDEVLGLLRQSPDALSRACNLGCEQVHEPRHVVPSQRNVTV